MEFTDRYNDGQPWMRFEDDDQSITVVVCTPVASQISAALLTAMVLLGMANASCQVTANLSMALLRAGVSGDPLRREAASNSSGMLISAYCTRPSMQ